MLRRSLVVAALTAATLMTAPSGWAQTYPSGPLKIIVPYAEGGSADIFARTISDGLAKQLGQQVTVENRPGAGGWIGLQIVARAAPDGRTLLLGQTGEIVVQPYLMKQSGPRPDPVALVAVMPLAVVVPSTAPYAKLDDLIRTARSAPRGLSVASPGRLTPGDLAIELFRIRTGARLASVPFDGGGPALNAVTEGLVDVYFSTLTSAMPYMQAGKVKILAVTSAERSPALPDVPTVQESGVRRFAVTQWAGVFVPRGTPDDIVTMLNREINQVLTQPEVKDKLVHGGSKVMPMSAIQFANFIRTDSKVYQDLLTAELCSEFVVESCSGGGVFSR
jgi:tripartite-type tricarboxylate transporter receptor subunit TctC